MLGSGTTVLPEGTLCPGGQSLSLTLPPSAPHLTQQRLRPLCWHFWLIHPGLGGGRDAGPRPQYFQRLGPALNGPLTQKHTVCDHTAGSVLMPHPPEQPSRMAVPAPNHYLVSLGLPPRPLTARTRRPLQPCTLPTPLPFPFASAAEASTCLAAKTVEQRLMSQDTDPHPVSERNTLPGLDVWFRNTDGSPEKRGKGPLCSRNSPPGGTGAH